MKQNLFVILLAVLPGGLAIGMAIYFLRKFSPHLYKMVLNNRNFILHLSYSVKI